MRLLLDDVQDLMNHLSRLDTAPVLRAGNSLASDAESLKDATREELGNVMIVACGGAMVIQLGTLKAELRWKRTEPTAVTAAADCVALLRKKRLPGPLAFLWLFTRVLAIFTFAPLVILGVLALVTKRSAEEYWSGGLRTLAAFAVFALFVSLVNMLEPTGRKSNARIQPYFQRERRDITLSRRTALIGAVAGAVLSAGLATALSWMNWGR